MNSEPTSATKTRDYTIVVAVRRNRNGPEFLMIRHRDRGWELPGGKIEPNEGPVHCALREFKEETGHLLAQPRFVMKIQKDNGLCWVFTGGLGEAVSGLDDESIVETAWFETLPPAGLAFPDDPYDEMGDLIGISFRGGR